MLQLVLWNLLLPDPHRECYSTFQCMAEGEETLQVVVLVGRRQGLLEREAGRAKATEERRRRRKQMYCDRVGTCFRANATTTWTLVVCMCVLMYTDRQGEPKRHSLCCCVRLEASSLRSPVCARMTPPGFQGWKVPCDPPSTWLEGPEEEVSTRHRKYKYEFCACVCYSTFIIIIINNNKK